LHTEADPRYRGAAIPSRAFKMLQTMTGPEGAASGDSGYQGIYTIAFNSVQNYNFSAQRSSSAKSARTATASKSDVRTLRPPVRAGSSTRAKKIHWERNPF
jgi:hypothetical protein